MEELEAFPKKYLKAEKLQVSTKYLLKYGSQENFMTYLFDYATLYIKNTLEKWMKHCIHPFSKKGNLRITKNYRGITPTATDAKVYNALLLHDIQPEILKILRKNQNNFRRNRSTTSRILTIHPIIEEAYVKKLETTLSFINFSKSFDSIHRSNITVTVMIIL